MKKFLALIMILTVVLGGCAQESVSSNDGVKAAQGIYEDKIVVGTTGAQQGALAFIGKPYFDGMKAYIEQFNENGGIDGKMIELMVLEDEFKPENAIANVQKLIEDEKVFALVGLFGTPGVKASLPTVQESGIPAVYFATGAKAPTEAGRNFFPVQPNYYYEGKLISQYALEHFEAERIALIYRSDDVGLDGSDGLKEGLNIAGKTESLVAELSYDAGSTDFTAQIAKAKDANADVIVCYGLSGGVSGVLKEMEKMGMHNTPVIVPYPNVSDSFISANKEAAPNAIENLYGMGWVDMTRPAVADLNAAMEKYFPESPVNAYTVSGWIAAETFVKGLEVAKSGTDLNSLKWEDYISAMEKLNYTEGIIPRIAYAPDLREGVVNMALTEVEGSTWETKTEYLEFNK